MRKVSAHQRKIHLWAVAASLTALVVSLFFLPSYSSFQSTGNNMYTVTLNGEVVGTVASESDAKSYLIDARRQLASEYAQSAEQQSDNAESGGEPSVDSESLYYAEAHLSVEGREVLWGKVDSHSTVVSRMKEVLESGHESESTLQRCYTVKIGNNILHLGTRDDVVELLTSALEQYDPDREYVVNLVLDTSKEINVLTTDVLSTKEQQKIEEKEASLPTAGVIAQLTDILNSTEPAVGKNFEDYTLGLTAIGFKEKIEVAESYMPGNEIMDLESAKEQILQSKAKKQIYEVRSGDSLSVIAEDYGLTVDDLLAMNPNYEDENATIRVGDEITVTVPEPQLSVDYTMQEYYEEDYEEDPIYEDNYEWYTTKTEVIQQPSSGHRKVIALVDYENGEKESSDIVKEEVVSAAVPIIIMRGTKVPPTYIWPVSGGYVSSGFGGRSAPKAGASTYHKGIDIAVSVGTAVMASSAGTVTSAGWQSGYGYVVYIQHSDGRETRYGHLSKILVSTGETVSQGEKIALSGNTGNSTGPHIHFEIRIDGTAVNPLNYIN